MILTTKVKKNLRKNGCVLLQEHEGKVYAWMLSRRAFLGHAIRLAAVATLPAVLIDRGLLQAAQSAEPDLVHETLNGLIAFFVPGPDPYSVEQDVSTQEPGGMDANITDALISTLNLAQPQIVIPKLSVAATAILNNVALAVNPDSAGGPFSSPFANLSFQQKKAVFGYLDTNPAWAPLASLLALSVAFLSYSEAGVFESGKLTGKPVGWTISRYQGVSRGHDEFKGYFQNRRKVLSGADNGSEEGEEHA